MDLVLIRGLPGSGKSTMAKTMALLGGYHVEADQYFCRSGEYRFNLSLLNAAHIWCLLWTERYLQQGRTVIVSNTFTQEWEMQPYFALAKELGKKVKIIEAKGTWKSIHGVPEEAIQRMRDRWEPIKEPS